MSSTSQQQQPTNTQQQLSSIRIKYDQEVKKNNNLLKMNSNLMRQNESYLNCFSLLKKWSNTFFTRFEQNYCSQQFQDSCIDVEQQGQEFVNRLTQMIDMKINELLNQVNSNNNYHSMQSPFITPTNNNNQLSKTNKIQQQNHNLKQQQQCPDCNRWKQLYIKQTKQTTKLQKLIDDSTMFDTQKQLNFTKLKDDTLQLLEGYLKLYRKEFQVNEVMMIEGQGKGQLLDESSKLQVNNNNSTLNHHNKQTVRPKDKSKQKRPGSNSGHKNKKSTHTTTNNNNNQSLSITKQPTPFSKQKTSRNNIKYTIQLSPQKSSVSLNQEKINNNISSLSQSTQLSKYLNGILSSYSQLSKNLQHENNQLKQQLKDLTEIINIYRQRERNQILFK